MAPIPSKTHTAGEVFGWQLPPRGQRRCIKCAKQDGFPRQTIWRDWSASCLKGCIYNCYIYIYVWLSWRPSSAGRLFGNVELLEYLTCQIHVHWALQVACGSRCLVYWFTWQSEGCIWSKSQKSDTCTRFSEIMTGLFSKSLMSWKAAQGVYTPWKG